MKQRIFNICTDEAKGNALAYLSQIKIDAKMEVVVRNAQESKTASQLGGLFGAWVTSLSKDYGHSEDKVHQWLKAKFLARIYVTDNAETSVNDLQAQWVELMAVYQMAGKHDTLERHAKRISLKWANMKQLKRFMTAIEEHFIDIGQPLEPLDPMWRLNK